VAEGIRLRAAPKGSVLGGSDLKAVMATGSETRPFERRYRAITSLPYSHSASSAL
jgi:hypothetical protein